MPHRLPNASESRVLLALYHKGPLNRNQLANLEAISMGGNAGPIPGLVEKTLVAMTDGKTYRLTEAGHELCEVCLKYNLMIETNYVPQPLTRQIARSSEVHRGILEVDFDEVRQELGLARAGRGRTIDISPEPALPAPQAPVIEAAPVAPVPIPPAPLASGVVHTYVPDTAPATYTDMTDTVPNPNPVAAPIAPPVAPKPVVKPAPSRITLPPPRIYSARRK